DAERGRAGDFDTLRPSLAAVMGDGGKNWRADITALEAIVENRPRYNGVAMTPRGDVLFVVKHARAAERSRTRRDAHRFCPGLAAIGRARHHYVRIRAAATAGL